MDLDISGVLLLVPLLVRDSYPPVSLGFSFFEFLKISRFFGCFFPLSG